MNLRFVFLFLLCPLFCRGDGGDLENLARLKPLFDYWMRDTYVTYVKEHDMYYLTGTTADPSREFIGEKFARDYNDGIYLWQSKDLKEWESLGCVWSFDEHGTWHNEFVPVSAKKKSNLVGFEGMIDERRAAWAPEIHFVKGNFYITACMNWNDKDDNEENGRVFLLRSSTGKAEGPYEDPVGKPLANRIDASLFEDDDGNVYFVWQENRIARMKDDMSGFAEAPRRVDDWKFPEGPYIEGAFIAKRNDTYYLVQAVWLKEKKGKRGRFRTGTKLYYDCVVSMSDNVYGPYGEKYTAIRGAGHNNIFKDRDGRWWASYFGNPLGEMRPSFTARPAIIPIKFEKDGRFFADWNKFK